MAVLAEVRSELIQVVLPFTASQNADVNILHFSGVQIVFVEPIYDINY